jgi:hypothetical protein
VERSRPPIGYGKEVEHELVATGPCHRRGGRGRRTRQRAPDRQRVRPTEARRRRSRADLEAGLPRQHGDRGGSGVRHLGLYGRWAGAVIAGAAPGSPPAKFYETLSGFTGAFLAGIGGARILTAEVDKQILRLTASKAAAGPPDLAGATAAAIASPAEALRIVQGSS